MRRQRRGSLIRLTAALGAFALTGACAHNDVLVFGTSTTIGLNVETASTNGAAPSIVLGYEREEAVWMPLVLNGRDSDLAMCADNGQGQCQTGSVPVSQAMYRSEITRDGRTNRDAYSVFASLGARFNGSANTNDGVGAGGGLAQFFATGNAALNISANEALVTALKVESPEGAAAQAAAVRGAAGETVDVDALLAADVSAIDQLETCSKGSDDGWHWSTILDAIPDSAVTPGDMRYLSRITSAAQMRTRLQSNPRLRTAALAAARSTDLC